MLSCFFGVIIIMILIFLTLNSTNPLVLPAVSFDTLAILPLCDGIWRGHHICPSGVVVVVVIVVAMCTLMLVAF
jgi:hypothetical protein